MTIRLSEKAYQLIKEKIITLQLPPLSVIDEQALREDLGLGRTPIREALHRLSAEGLVIIAPRRGMFVADISITDLAKIFEVRVAMEGFCARLAAQRISATQIIRMDAAVVEDLDHVEAGDSATLMEIDERFHKLLYEAAGNEFLSDTLDRLHAISMRIWYLVLNRLGDVRPMVEQHQDIVCALKDRDADLAEELLQRHINDFQEQIRAVL